MKKKSKILTSIASVPGIFAALLPTLTCPACWPAYAGLLSSMGIGFFNYSTYLLPISTALLILALIGLAYKAKQRHGYWPLLIGTFGSVVILVSKFVYDYEIIVYIGVGILIIASIWNALPVKTKENEHYCPR